MFIYLYLASGDSPTHFSLGNISSPARFRNQNSTNLLKNSTETTKSSLSQINNLHSHRNLKSSYQMLLAESMFEKNLPISLDSCLMITFQQCLNENQILSCFVQFMESLGKDANKIIKCFFQANCIMISVKENFSDINIESIKDDDDNHIQIVMNENQTKHFNNFFNDFYNLFNQYFTNNEETNCDKFIDEKVYKNISQLFQENIPKNNLLKALHLFYLFWNNLYNKIEIEYYEKFLRSNFFLKYEYEILSSANFTLSDILFSPTPISSTFLDFMTSEGMKKYVDFLVMYRNYKTFSCQYSDASIIYNRFFNTKNKTESFLDVSENNLTELNCSIDQRSFMPECFDKIALILLQYFSKTYFTQFIESNVFNEYVQSCNAKLNPDKNKHFQQSSQLKAKTIVDSNKELPDTVISPNKLICDQENLWNRNLKGHLQFTYIDKYGRMNSSLEPEPTSKNDTKLSQLFRRLSFNPNENKVKQDDAWKVAESIINDVCSVTIQNSRHNLDNNEQ